MQQAFANRQTSGTRAQPVYDPLRATPNAYDADSGANCYMGPPPVMDGGTAYSVSPAATTPLAPAAAAIVAAHSAWRSSPGRSAWTSALLEYD